MTENIITAENLTKIFDGKRVVDDLGFVVPKGALFAFLGQNGAGKSTTINMLIGLLKKDGGRITYDGGTDFAAFKSHIGVVFQNNILDNLLTVKENLLFNGTVTTNNSAERDARYKEIIALLSLEDVQKQRFKTLSGGQKRKAEIARALFTSPQVLFLDEPTTGLDPKTRAEVWTVLHEVRRKTGMTVFLTTHYMEETVNADSVVIIHKGRRICQGTPAELKNEYSFDRLLITPHSSERLIEQLNAQNAEYKENAGVYAVRAEDPVQSIKLLYKIRDNIRFYEVIKGSMDDVFLNAVGESVKEDAAV